MPKKPVIGITCEVIKQKPDFSEFDLICNYRYVRSVARAGGIPILLPLSSSMNDISKLLREIDGLLIIGGDDIHPSFYGERVSSKVKPTYRGRTQFEIKLCKTALKQKIPILGICHGMQLLNVIYGGTLYQDICSEIKGARNHRCKKEPLHHVNVKRGSLCHKIFKKTSFPVMSSHHQAVKRVGKSLQVTAVSEDGIVEAIEGPSHTMAVQWHPERQPNDSTQRRVFDYFVRLAKSRKK